MVHMCSEVVVFIQVENDASQCTSQWEAKMWRCVAILDGDLRTNFYQWQHPKKPYLEINGVTNLVTFKVFYAVY